MVSPITLSSAEAAPVSLNVTYSPYTEPEMLDFRKKEDDSVLESVMHPLDSIRRRWIAKEYLKPELVPPFSDTALLPPLNDHLEELLRKKLSEPIVVGWSEVPELSYTVKTSLKELLALIPEAPSLIGSMVPHLLLMEKDYLRIVLRTLNIPEKEIDTLLNVLAEYPPPPPNDIDFRWIRENATEDFLDRARALITSKLAPEFVSQHREAIINFLGNAKRLSSYSNDALIKNFITRTAFSKCSPIMFNSDSSSFQVTRLRANATLDYAGENSEPLAPEFIEANALVSKCWQSSLTIPLKELMSNTQGKTHPEGQEAWQGILQLIFGFRQFADSEKVSAHMMAASVALSLQGLCNFTPIDEKSINSSIAKLHHPLHESALALARRAANSLQGRQSGFVPLLHSSLQTLCKGDSVIDSQALWDTTMSYIMNPPHDIGLKALASSKWDSLIAAQPPKEGLLLKVISCERLPAQTAMNLLHADAFLKLFCEPPKDQNTTPLRLREHAEKWVIVYPMYSESIRVPFAPQAALQDILEQASDPRTNDTLLKLLQLNPPPPLRAPAVNSLHRFTAEHAITSEQLGAEAKLLLQTPSKALHYLGLRYLCLALLMGPSTPESQASMTCALLDGIPQVLGNIKDPTLLEPLLGDLELILPLCGFGALVEGKPGSTPSLALLRTALANPQTLPSAWLCTLAGSTVTAHRTIAQRLWGTHLAQNILPESTTIQVIKKLNQQDPTAALSIFRRAEKVGHLKPEQCITLLPSLQMGLRLAGATDTFSLDEQIKNIFTKLLKAGEYIQAAFTFGLYDPRASQRLELWHILLEDQIAKGHWEGVASTLIQGYPSGKKKLIASPVYSKTLNAMIESDLRSALNVVAYYPKTDSALIQHLFEAVSRCQDSVILRTAEQWLLDHSKPIDRCWPKLITAWATTLSDQLINLLYMPPTNICELVDAPNELNFVVHVLSNALELARTTSNADQYERALKGFYELRDTAFAHLSVLADSSINRILDLRLSCTLLKNSPKQAFDLLTSTLKTVNEITPLESEEVAKSFRIYAAYLAAQDKATLRQMGNSISALWKAASSSQHMCELLVAADALSAAGVTNHIPTLMSVIGKNKDQITASATGAAQIRAARFLTSELALVSLEEARQIRVDLTNNLGNTYFDQTTQAMLWNRCLELELQNVARDDADHTILLLKEVGSKLDLLKKLDPASIPSCLASAIDLVLGLSASNLASFKKIKNIFFNALPKSPLKDSVLQSFVIKALQCDTPPESAANYLSLIASELEAVIKCKTPEESVRQALSNYLQQSIAYPADNANKRILTYLTPKILGKYKYTTLHLIVNGTLPKNPYPPATLDTICQTALDELLAYPTSAARLAAVRILNHLADSVPTVKTPVMLLDYLDKLLAACGDDIHTVIALSNLRQKLEKHEVVPEASEHRSKLFLNALKAFACSQKDQPAQLENELVAPLALTISDTLNRLFLSGEYVEGTDVWKDLHCIEPLMFKIANHDVSQVDTLPRYIRQAAAKPNRDLQCSQLWNSWVTNLALSHNEMLHAKAQDYFEEGISRQWMQQSATSYTGAYKAIQSLQKSSDLAQLCMGHVVGISRGLSDDYDFLINESSAYLQEESTPLHLAEKLVRVIHEDYAGDLASLPPLLINLSLIIRSEQEIPILVKIWELSLASLVRRLPVKECLDIPLTLEESAKATSAFDPIYQQLIHNIMTKKVPYLVGLSLLQVSLFTHLACQTQEEESLGRVLLQNNSKRVLKHVTKNGAVVLPFEPYPAIQRLYNHEEDQTPILLFNTLMKKPLTSLPEKLKSHICKVIQPRDLQREGLHLLLSSQWTLRYLGARLICLATAMDPDQAPLPPPLLYNIPGILSAPIDKCILEALVTDLESAFPLCGYDQVVIDAKDQYRGLELIRTALADGRDISVKWIETLAISSDELREEAITCWCILLADSSRMSFDEDIQLLTKKLVSDHPNLCLTLLRNTWDKGKVSAITCISLLNEIEKHVHSLKLDKRIRTKRAIHNLRQECNLSNTSLETANRNFPDHTSKVFLDEGSLENPSNLLPAQRVESLILILFETTQTKKKDYPELLHLINDDTLWETTFPELINSHEEKAVFYKYLLNACLKQAIRYHDDDKKAQVLIEAVLNRRSKLESLFLMPEVWPSRFIVDMDIASTLCHLNSPLFTRGVQYGANALYLNHIVKDTAHLIEEWDSTIAASLPIASEEHQWPSRPTSEILDAAAKEIRFLRNCSNIEETIQSMSKSLMVCDPEVIQSASSALTDFYIRAIQADVHAKVLLPLAIRMVRKGLRDHLPHAISAVWDGIQHQQSLSKHQRDVALDEQFKQHLYHFLYDCLTNKTSHTGGGLFLFQRCLESPYSQSILSSQQQAQLWDHYIINLYNQIVMSQKDISNILNLTNRYASLMLAEEPNEIPKSIEAGINVAVATKCDAHPISVQNDPVAQLFKSLPLNYYKANALPKNGLNYSVFFSVLEKTLQSLRTDQQVKIHLPYWGQCLDTLTQNITALPPEYCDSLKQCMIKYIVLAACYKIDSQTHAKYSAAFILSRLKNLKLLSGSEYSNLALFINEHPDKQERTKGTTTVQSFVPAIELALSIQNHQGFGKALSLTNAACTFGRNASHLKPLEPILKRLFLNARKISAYHTSNGSWGFKIFWAIANRLYAKGSPEIPTCHELVFNQICAAAESYRSLDEKTTKKVNAIFNPAKDFHGFSQEHVLEGLAKGYYTATPQSFWNHLTDLLPILMHYLKTTKDAPIGLFELLERASDLPVFQTSEQREARIQFVNRWIQLVRPTNHTAALSFWMQVRKKGWYAGFDALHEVAKQSLR